MNNRTIAGIAQLVEHNLAKVGVASSSLVSRLCVAEWQSGYASACKAADTGSIPVSALKILELPGWRNW